MSLPSLSPILLRSGGPPFLPFSTQLKAGPLDLLLEQGEVRRVRLGGIEILRRIYLAVRGPDWRTIPPALSDLKVDAQEDSFRVAYTLAHRQDEFDFAWKVEVEGDAAGRIRFRAVGRAASAFATNRVGMCLLHPPAACAGMPARWTAPDGTVREGVFPETISPHEPFKDITAFSHRLADGTWVDLAYAGETFEMEDQRNWTDGSFKTYCPPAHLPKPRKIEPGWEILQEVTLSVRRESATPLQAPPVAPTLRLGAAPAGRLPDIGFSLGSHGRAPSARDAERIRALAPAHLRADFRLADPAGLPAALARAAEASRAFGAPLEASLIVGEDVDGSLAAFAGAWRDSGCRAARFLVFHQKSDSTPEPVLEAAVRHLRDLAPGAAFALGSKNDFVLLNRGRPSLAAEPAASAALAYAMCPQVHAFDNRNLVESLEGQEWTLRTARALWPKAPLVVSTVSLKRSPFAASLKLAGPPPSDAWIKQADARQLSLFAVGWALGSLERLARQGVASATYFETTGPLGLLAGESLAPEERNLPGVDFRLDPAWAFPLYQLFADLAEVRGAEVIALENPSPLRCTGLALRSGGKRVLLLANHEGAPLSLRVEGAGGTARLRRLDEKSARSAVEDPEGFRGSAPESLAATEGPLEITLKPCEYVRLDLD